MNNNRIIGVADGINDKDAVNMRQFKTKFLFEQEMRHDNQEHAVPRPQALNKGPFSFALGGWLEIKESGYYLAIYTDFYKGDTTYFQIQWRVPGGPTYPSGPANSGTIRKYLNSASNWTPFTAAGVFMASNDQGRIEMKLWGANQMLDGGSYASLFLQKLSSL